MFKKYIIYYIIFLLLFSIPVGHSIGYLYAMDEFDTPQEIIAKQAQNPYCIYSSGLNDGITPIKLAAYEFKKPDVLVIGSSRALQIREAFFNSSFYNMGYTTGSIAEARMILHEILPIHKPKLMLMNVDFWWFHEKYRMPGKKLELVKEDRKVKLKDVKMPIKWAIERKIDGGNFFFKTYDGNEDCGMGVKGYERNAGYAGDGSFYYTDVVTGKVHNDKSGVKADYQFKNIKERIAEGNRSFFYGSNVNEAHLQEFIEVADYIKSQNVEVIFFISPLAPETIKLMEAHDYSYIEDLQLRLRQAGIKIYDYRRLEGMNDCEFIDGFHGGDVAYARMLNNMAKHDKRLAGVVNKPYLENVISAHGGLAMIPNEKVTKLKEQDFLGLGCKKN